MILVCTQPKEAIVLIIMITETIPLSGFRAGD